MRRTSLALLVLAMLAPSVASASFRDVPSNSVYATPLRVLEQLGVVSGFGDGTFRPGNAVTRAEYLKMLYRALNRSTELNFVDSDMPLPFTDVPQDSWYRPYVHSAFNRGIVRGTDEDSFSPNRTVTQYEATKMLVATEFSGMDLAETLFPEDDSALAHKNAAEWLRAKNLTRTANLDAPMPRGDVAELLYRWVVVKKTSSASYDASLDAKLSIVPIAVPTDKKDQIEAIKEALDLLETNYLYSEDLYENDALEAAVRGIVDALGDPHSSYYTGSETTTFLDRLSSTDVGIGVFIAPEEEALAVVQVLANSPAAKAGIVEGDRIMAIDGVVVADDPLAAYGYLSGLSTPGTLVSLDLRRTNGTRETVRVALAVITQPTVEMVAVDSDGILAMRIWEFSDSTGGEFETLLGEADLDMVRGILLDMRGNPGGFISSAWDVGVQFLPEGAALAIIENPRSESVLTTDVRGPLVGIPVVVLVDSGSASAAEIVAAALRDNVGAQLVGELTYGKGTVQALLPVGAKGLLRVTIAKWLTPKGANVHEVGLKPNLEIEAPEDPRVSDPPRDAALELLRKQVVLPLGM